MGAPSIYSDKFSGENRKKIRRRKIIVAAALFLTFLLFFVPYISSRITEYKTNGGKFKEKYIDPSTVATTTLKTVAASDTKTETPLKSLNQTLKSGITVRVNYKEIDGKVSYDSIAGDVERFSYDISPDKSSILLNDTDEEGIIILGQDKKAVDVTADTLKYGETIFRRDDLKHKEQKSFSEDAKFLNNNTVIYITSTGPSEARYYIRTFKTDSFKDQPLVKGIEGKKIRMVKKTDKGFQIEIDGKMYLINDDLTVNPL